MVPEQACDASKARVTLRGLIQMWWASSNTGRSRTTEACQEETFPWREHAAESSQCSLGPTDGEMDGLMDKRTEGRIDGWNRHTEKQTDSWWNYLISWFHSQTNPQALQSCKSVWVQVAFLLLVTKSFPISWRPVRMSFFNRGTLLKFEEHWVTRSPLPLKVSDPIYVRVCFNYFISSKDRGLFFFL